MKDTEFIELLNLYLDHEISPADAARLEAEVQRDPQRRQVYQQYCRMQKACTLLAADFTTDTPAVVALQPQARRAVGPNLFAIGGLMAAAACVAFVLLSRTSSPSSTNPDANGQNLAQTTASPAVSAPQQSVAVSDGVRSIPRTVTMPQRTEFKPVFTLLSPNPTASDALQDQRFDWIKKVQFSSLDVLPVESRIPNSLRFEPRNMLKPNPRSFGPGQLQPTLENSAFTFQR
jgi:anti-sigma factor RsiW